LRKFAESQYDTGDKSAARASIAECIGLSSQSSPGHLPFALAVLADWERQAQNFPEAANLYREAIGAFGKLCQEDPDNVKENRYLAQFQLMLAESLVPQGALGEARRQLAASRELHARLTVIDPSNTDLRGDRAQSLRVSGRINMQAGEDAAAADDFSQALEVYRELTAKDPSFVFWRQGMCDAGDSLDKLARLPTATRATRLANVAAQINLAEMWLAAGIAANAREYLDAATRLAEHLAAEPNPDPAIPGLLERCGALRGKAIGPPD
jgi:tetratricopeptide (TPR) repeat protein